jgi:hypothetical protein
MLCEIKGLVGITVVEGEHDVVVEDLRDARCASPA